MNRNDMPSGRAIAAAPPGVDIGRLIGALRRRWKLILLMAVVGASLGFEIQRHRTPLYTAGATILIDPKRPDVYGADVHFANAMADGTKIGSIVPFLSSTVLLHRVILEEKLLDNPYFNGLQPSLTDKLISLVPFFHEKPPVVSPEMREATVLYRLRRALKAERMAMTYIVNIKVTADTAPLAQRLANAVANAYLDDQRSNQQRVSASDGNWLAHQVEDLKAELIRSEESVESIRQKFGLSDTGLQTGSSTHSQQIADLNLQLSHAEGEVTSWRAKAAQADRIRRMKGSLEGIPEVVASVQIGKLHQGMSDLDRKIADLSAHYTTSYPDLVQARRDRETLKRQIDAEASRIVDSIHNQLESAIAQRNNLKTMLDNAVATNADAEYAANATNGRIELREAQRIAAANRALYDAQLARLSRVKEQQSRGDVEARIISSAELPTSSSALLTVVFAVGGMCVGFAAGSGIALIGMLRESSFVDLAWVETELSIPFLGSLPLLKRSQLMRAGQPTIMEYLRTKPLSQFAECARLLRTALKFTSRRPPQIIQITSAVPGEGKSTVAATLAMSAAQAGIKTILVDLDVRNPSASKIFNVQSTENATDALQKVSVVGRALVPYDQIPLTIVGTGTEPRLRPGFVDTPMLSGLIKELASHCDLLFLDSPPVLAVSDAILIASVADATLLVVQWQATPKNVVKQAVKMLRASRARLAGLVLNKMDQIGSADFSAGNYGMYYTAIKNDFIPNSIPTKLPPPRRGRSLSVAGVSNGQ